MKTSGKLQSIFKIMLVITLMILSPSVFSAESHALKSITPIRISLPRFENATGKDDLYWVGVALSLSMQTNILYLKGFETKDYLFFESQHAWDGKYEGDVNDIAVTIWVRDSQSAEKVHLVKKYHAPLSGLLKKTSEAVLEMAAELGVAVDEGEKQRVLSRQTESPETLKCLVEGLLAFSVIEDANNEQEKEALKKKGEAGLLKALQSDPNYAEGWYLLGEFYGYWWDSKKSQEAYRKALDLKPDLVAANESLGRLLVEEDKDFEEGMFFLKKAVFLNPSKRGCQQKMYEFLLTSGKYEAARTQAKAMLKNISATARVEAINVFVRLGDKTALSQLLEQLKDPDKFVRGNAIYAFGQLGDKAVIPYLIPMKNDPDRDIRMTLAAALGDLGDKTAVAVLVELLEDADREVRLSAVSALGMIEDRSVVPVLLNLLQNNDKPIQVQAAVILARLGENAGKEVLLKALKDPEKGIRKKAIFALKRFKDKATVPMLIDIFKKDKEFSVRLEAAIALGEIGDGRAAQVLVDYIMTEKEAGDFRIFEAVGKVGDESTVAAFIEALKSPEAKIRENAAMVLGKLKNKTAIAALIKALDDPEKWVKIRAIDALTEINDASAIPALCRILKEGKDGSAEAAKALGKMGDRSVVALLITTLQNPSDYVRAMAAEALGNLGDQSVIPALLKALSEGDWGEHEPMEFPLEIRVALALRKLGNREGIPVILKALREFLRERYIYKREIIAKIFADSGEGEGLCNDFSVTGDVYMFNMIRKKLLFPERFDLLTESRNGFLASSGYYLLSLKAREEGRYEEQLKQVSRALQYIDPKDRTALTILCYWLKAQAELKLDKPKDALASVQKAGELLEYLSRKERTEYAEPFEAYTLFLKGEIFSAIGEKKPAVGAYEETLETLERSKKDYYIREAATKLEAMVRTSLGAIQIKMGKENLEKAVETGRNYQANDSVEMENEEKRYLELSRQKIAEGSYEEAQKLMEELNLRRTNYINRRTKINLADKEKQAVIDQYRKKQEEIESLSRKIEALALKKGEAQGGGKTLPDEGEIKKLEAEKNDKRRELQVYLTGLKKTYPDLAALLGAKPIELTVIQEQLGEGTGLLQYLILPDKLVVFVIKKGGIDIVETPLDKNDLRDKVASLRKAIYSKTEGKNSRRIDPLCLELYNLLIKPLEEAQKLKGIKVLGIAPNAFLHQLPFGVLKNSQDQYLIDRYTLFYINSTSLLGVALDRGKETNKGEKSLLALSNPDGSLPASDTEVADIAKYFNKKQTYSRKEAKKSIIQAGNKDYTILHLSTHGIFDPLDSAKNHLLMADGDLTMEEIWGLPLKGVSLTVLSACDTGLGDVLSGDDVVSLENAFIYAGSSTVVATLWKVADQSTAELMMLFYQNLSKGMTKAEALSQAQRELKNKYPHPFFWSAFMLRGDWR